MDNELMFSKKSDEWATPQWLFDELNKEFSFTLDVAATSENSKCGTSFLSDALNIDWICPIEGPHICWMNPPYSMCNQFIKKAYEQSLKGVFTVALVPARTDTKWFHEYCYNKQSVEIRFIKGRLKFGDSKNSAPFPSILVIFK
jgi:site-specific DNA-methyltransferase (adenine-specific)